MIHQLSAQIAANAPKSDLKTDSSPKDNKEKLNSKELLSEALKQNLVSSKDISSQEALQKFAQNQVNEKLSELVNKFLEQINTNKNPSPSVLKQANHLNFAPNFANELKTLSAELSKNSVFTEVLNKLEQILKPASEIKANNLAPLLKNSGVFFEAKLKDALNGELLPQSFHKLLNTIKSLSHEGISNQIAKLVATNLNPEETLKELKIIIKQNRDENKEVLKNSNFKALLELGSKIENFKNYISKNPDLAQNKIIQIANQITKELSLLKNGFFKALAKPENLTIKDPNILKQVVQGFEKLQDTLKNILEAKSTSSRDLPKISEQKSSVLEPPQYKNNEASKDGKNASTQSPKEDTKSSILNPKETQNPKIPNNQDVKEDKTPSSKQNLTKDNQALRDDISTQSPKEDTKSSILNPKETQNPKIPSHEKLEQDKTPNSTQKNTQNSAGNKEVLKDGKDTSVQNLKEYPKSIPNPKEAEIQNPKTPSNESKTPSPMQKDTQNSVRSDEVLRNDKNLEKETRPNITTAKELPSKNEIKENPNKTHGEIKEAPSKIYEKGEENPKFLQNNPNQGTLNVFKEPIKQDFFKNLAFKTENGNLEDLENLSKDLSSLSRKINEGLKQLDPNSQNAKANLSELKNLENKLNSSLKDLQNIKVKTEQDVVNEIRHDVKSTLLQISNLAKNEGNEAVYNQANRLLAQIEINQLMSLANHSISTYLPFFWDDLNDSKVVFKRGKKDKFFTQIKLEFAKLGTLEVLICLSHEKYIDINIMAENKNFRKTIYENAHELKRSINKAGLLSANFFVGDIIRSKLDPRNMRSYDLQMGMDKKV